MNQSNESASGDIDAGINQYLSHSISYRDDVMKSLINSRKKGFYCADISELGKHLKQLKGAITWQFIDAIDSTTAMPNRDIRHLFLKSKSNVRIDNPVFVEMDS